MARTPYASPGRYHRGVWLIAKQGKGVLVDHSHLPHPGAGYQFYWLGVHPDTLAVITATDKLHVKLRGAESTDFTSQIDSALRGKPAALPGPGNLLQQILGAAAAGGVPAPGAVSAAGAGGLDALGAGGGAADAGAAGAAAGGSSLAKGAGVAGAIAAAISDPLDFLRFVSWIFHPRNWLRAAEFVVGIVLMMFGIQALTQSRGERLEGFTTGESALTRSGLGRVVRELGHANVSRRRTDSSGEKRRRLRPRPAPHRSRRTALRVRYAREERVSARKEQQRRES